MEKYRESEQEGKKFDKTAKEVKQSVDSQNISFIAQVAAVAAVYGGMNQLISSVSQLGLVTDATALKLRKMSAAVGLLYGSFQLLRGAIQIMQTLKAAHIGAAIAATFNKILHNPAAMATVGIATGVSAGVGVALYKSTRSSGGGGGSNTQVNANISFNNASSTSGTRAATEQTLNVMGGI